LELKDLGTECYLDVILRAGSVQRRSLDRFAMKMIRRIHLGIQQLINAGSCKEIRKVILTSKIAFTAMFPLSLNDRCAFHRVEDLLL